MQGFIQRFIKVYRPLITKLNELLTPYDLSYSLWQVIFFVKKNGPSTLVDISNFYNVEKPTITRRVHRLEEIHIVEQIPGKDKREKVIQLTDVGEDIYNKCREEITQLESSMMEGIPIEQQDAIFQLLSIIRDNIVNKEGNKVE